MTKGPFGSCQTIILILNKHLYGVFITLSSKFVDMLTTLGTSKKDKSSISQDISLGEGVDSPWLQADCFCTRRNTKRKQITSN